MNAIHIGLLLPDTSPSKGKRAVLNRVVNRRDERGQILLIVAAGILFFVSLVGLVIDTGVGFHERRDLQNSSDLSAMAGTKVIADHYLDGGRTGAQVYAAIEASLTANGCVPADGCDWTAIYVRPDPTVVGSEIQMGAVTNGGAIPANAQGVQVDTASTPATFFMRVIGIDEIAVAVEATAMTSSLLNEAPYGVLLPIAAFDSDYEPGVEYEITAGQEGPGNFGWLTWNGSPNEPTLAASLCTPDNPEIPSFPVWIQGSTGMTNGNAVRDCMTNWLGSTVLIPIWAQTNHRGGSNLEYEIITLGAFTLTDFNQHANKVKGHFVEFYALPGVPAGYGSPPCPPTSDSCWTRTNFIGLTR
jgi:Flp pilus assembly protein TadG